MDSPEMMMKVTPYLAVQSASDAIAWYVKAFGARELYRLQDAGGRVGHAELQVGDSIIYLSDEWAGHPDFDRSRIE